MVEPVRPPRDGLIYLRPGEAFEWNDSQPISPAPVELQERVRTIRGRVLSACFDLESIIESVITTYFLGDGAREASGPAFERLECMQEQVLRDMGFEKKIRVVRDIARRVMADTQRADQFGHALSQVRHLRNVMAHYPCWLEPIRRPGSIRVVGFKAYIARGKEIWELNQRQIGGWEKSLADATRAAEGLLTMLAVNPGLALAGR